MTLTLSNVYDLFFPSEDYDPQETYTEEDAKRYSEAKQELENYISDYIETCGKPQEETFVFKTGGGGIVKVKAHSLEEAMFEHLTNQPPNEYFETSRQPNDCSTLLCSLESLEELEYTRAQEGDETEHSPDAIEIFKRLVKQVRTHEDTAEYTCSRLELV